MSNLKSDQSVDSVTTHSVAAPSEARLLEVSEVPRICITRSLNGRVGSTSLQQCSSPSPIPAFPILSAVKRLSRETPRDRTSPRKTSPNKLYRVSRLLIPRSYSTPAIPSLVKSGLAGQILSTRTLSGLKIGGRLTNRPCMDSAEGDTTARFRAPGSILIPSHYFSLGRDNLQGSQNDRGWTETPVTCHSRAISQC